MNFIKKNLFALIEIVLIALGFVFLATDCIKTTTKGLVKVSTEYSGYDAFLGQSKSFDTSAAGIIIVILLVVALAVAVAKMVMSKQVKLLNIVLLVVTLAAGIFFLAGVAMLNPHGLTLAQAKKLLDVKLMYGVFLGAACQIVAAALAGVEAFVLKK